MPDGSERSVGPPRNTTRGTMDWWWLRSLTLRLATVTLLLALTVQLGAVSTGHWAITTNGTAVGLFTYLTDAAGRQVLDAVTPIACPAVAVVSTVMLMLINFINVIFMIPRFHLVMPAVIVFTFISGLMLMTVMVTWAVGHLTGGQRLSWSFVMAAVVVVLDLAACGLCILDFTYAHPSPLHLRFPPPEMTYASLRTADDQLEALQSTTEEANTEHL